MTEKSLWEKAYSEVSLLWGVEPDHVLKAYAELVPQGPILDLGIGEGRNALFFAKMGYEVEGIDISETAVERCMRRSQGANLKVQASVGDLRELDIPQARYSLIIAAWVLNFLRKGEADKMMAKIRDGLKRDGIVYVAVFSTDDPGFTWAKEKLELVEENTFYSRKMRTYRHYFIKDEIVLPFADFRLLYHADGTELDLDHGEPHYHGFIIYCGQRR